MAMNFRHLVMREFESDFISDPREPCTAFVAAKDSPNLSLQYQLVYEPDKTSCVEKQIHVIASPSKEKAAAKFFKTHYKTDLISVGKTYCVAPYVMGYARLGKDTARNVEEVIKIISSKGSFDEYLCNWLETERGYQEMVRDLSAEDPQERSVEEVHKELQSGSEKEVAERLVQTKLNYVAMHAGDPKAFGYDAYVLKRMNEFRDAMKPLTEKHRFYLLELYYGMSHDEEAFARGYNAKDYIKEPRLLRDLIAW